jgi:hypothetical protein
MQKDCLRFVSLGNLDHTRMQSVANQWRRNSRVLLIVGYMSASVGCSSQYEPEGQFWPDLGPSSSGGSSTAAEAEAAGSDPTGLEDETTNGEAAPSPTEESAGASLPISRSPMGAPPPTNTSSSNAVVGASPTCSLSVSVTTTQPGGKYRPRNVGAIWIADSTGAFVKSLDVWGNRRLSHVTAWTAATKAAGVSGNKVDAVSSATLSAHRTHNVTWNCKDYTGTVAPDDTYRVYFEVTDSNSAGPNHFETFTKGPSAATVQGNATNFNGIVLTFQP